MRLPLLCVGASFLRLSERPQKERTHAFEDFLQASAADHKNVSNVTNGTNWTNATQDRVLPLSPEEAEAATPLREEQCNLNLIQRLEADWVSACYNWDNTDPNLATMLQKWVDFGRSTLTELGTA